MEEYNYRPLPNYLTISSSNIEGLGLFSLRSIDKNTTVGLSHVFDKRFEDGLIRLPLAGFLNHSSKPNCILKKESIGYFLVTVENIDANTELTVDYTLYLCGINYKNLK